MTRFLFFLAAVAPLVVAQGCTRTADGSVEMPEPRLERTFVPGVRVLTLRRPPPPQPPAPSTSFPEPPLARIAPSDPSRATVSRRTAPKRRSSTAAGRQRDEAGERDVVCRNVTTSGGRFRVVCD